jgi:uncharacterized protein with von Willebrand factor type A (vWA) domain
MTNQPELLLYGVFRMLMARNLPLGVADYLDAIRALRLQHRASSMHRPPSREALRRLCQILWSRSVEESRLIDEIFRTIPPPPQEDLDQLMDLLHRRDPEASGPEPGPDPTGTTSLRDAQEGAGAADAPARVAIDIQSGREAGGVPLPYPVVPPRGTGTFVLRPQTVVSSRTLAVLWRRYRRMRRIGPATELDYNATIAERCRRGLLDRPVWRPARVNRARLMILADVSPSMTVWRPFLDALAHSLTLSRLPGAELYYFSNVPRQSLFCAPSLSGAVPTMKTLAARTGAGVLVISDAGAARGHLNRPRVEKTSAFIGAAGAGGRSIVWINPMPPSRWSGTTAEALASANGATFLPLTVPSLIRAVDILRGVKSH